MAIFILKAVVAGLLIAFASRLADKNPLLAGFIIALPLSTLISLFLIYGEHRDMEKVNQFAVSIFAAAPLTLVFFIPFFLNKWMKMNFPVTMTLAMTLVTGVYFLHQWVLRIWFR